MPDKIQESYHFIPVMVSILNNQGVPDKVFELDKLKVKVKNIGSP